MSAYSLIVFLPKREKYKEAAEMDTALAMTTAPCALHRQKKILYLLYMHLVKVQCIRGLMFGRVRIHPFHHRKVVNFEFPELRNSIAGGLRVS